MIVRWKSALLETECLVDGIKIGGITRQHTRIGDPERWLVLPCVGEHELVNSEVEAQARLIPLVKQRLAELQAILA